MNILRINKDSITSFEYDENTEATEKYVEKNIEDLNFPFTRYFSQVIEISEDVTVGDFMLHLKKYSEIIDLCFYGYINGESIVPYCDLVLQEPEEKYFVDLVELFWATELVGDEYCLFGTFHGIVIDEEKYSYVEANRMNSFPLDLVPVNQWKHCKLILNEVIKASSIDEDEHSQVFKLRNRWTLFELIQFFLYELMCYGSIENQQQEIELYETNKIKYEGFRVDPDFANKLDKEELKSFIEEIESQIEITQEALDVAVEDDDFESANELKKESDELILELSKMKNKLKEL
jgi:hypothetical protein